MPAGQDCAFTSANAGEVSYPVGFEDYQAVASVDQEHWFRVPTEFGRQAPGDSSPAGMPT